MLEHSDYYQTTREQRQAHVRVVYGIFESDNGQNVTPGFAATIVNGAPLAKSQYDLLSVGTMISRTISPFTSING